MARLLVRAVGVLAFGAVASACSSIPDWVDPTTWLSSNAPPAADGTTPDLADIPGKPPTTTPDEQKQVADSLAADRAQAGYSAEQLRAGADQPSTAPPPPAPPQSTDSTKQDSAKAAEADTTNDTPPEPEKKGNATFEAAQGHTESAAAPSSGQAAQDTAPPPQQVASAASSSAPVQSGSTSGFQASSAPAPDPSVGQFVSPTLLSRYQQTATRDTGSTATSGTSGTAATSTATAIVDFTGQGTKLTAAARAKVREVAQTFQSSGATGFVRVVGHANPMALKASAEKRQELAFQRSQDRANAVARELIKDGVPAAKVLVETAGENPAADEADNRAEIFLQS